MADSPSTASAPSTPPISNAHLSNSELSPPDSQSLAPQQSPSLPSPFTPLSSQPGSSSSANAGKKANSNTSRKMPASSTLNANGKRERNGRHKDAMKGEAGDAGAVDKEDEPGYVWSNPKARDEASRAMGAVVEPGRFVGARYGDILLGG